MPVLDFDSRVTCDNRPFQHVTDNHGSGAYDGTFADRHAWTDKRPCRDPRVLTDRHGSRHQPKVVRLVVVCRLAKIMSTGSQSRVILPSLVLRCSNRHPIQ